MAADVNHPTVIDKLEILGKLIDVEVFSMGVDAIPADTAKAEGVSYSGGGYDGEASGGC